MLQFFIYLFLAGLIFQVFEMDKNIKN